MNSFGSHVDNNACHGEGSMAMLDTPITQTPEANTGEFSMEEEIDANEDFGPNMQNSSSMASGSSQWRTMSDKVFKSKDGHQFQNSRLLQAEEKHLNLLIHDRRVASVAGVGIPHPRELNCYWLISIIQMMATCPEVYKPFEALWGEHTKANEGSDPLDIDGIGSFPIAFLVSMLKTRLELRSTKGAIDTKLQLTQNESALKLCLPLFESLQQAPADNQSTEGILQDIPSHFETVLNLLPTEVQGVFSHSISMLHDCISCRMSSSLETKRQFILNIDPERLVNNRMSLQEAIDYIPESNDESESATCSTCRSSDHLKCRGKRIDYEEGAKAEIGSIFVISVGGVSVLARPPTGASGSTAAASQVSHFYFHFLLSYLSMPFYFHFHFDSHPLLIHYYFRVQYLDI